MTEIALGMIVRNESAILQCTLPVISPSFDIKIALDTGSTDNTRELLRSHGFLVYEMEWKWDYSQARNRLIEHLESVPEIDWALMLDADEAMWPYDISYLKNSELISHAYAFPRYNLIYEDMQHWESHSYPDAQTRLFALRQGLHYRNRLHETLSKANGHIANATMVPHRHIYHYGSCKPIKEVWLKHHNYALLKAGGAPHNEMPTRIAEMPDDVFLEIYAAAAPAAAEFSQPHPLQ